MQSYATERDGDTEAATPKSQSASMTSTESEIIAIEEAGGGDKEPHVPDSVALLSADQALKPLSSPATLPRATWEVLAIAVFDSFLVVLSALFLALAFVAKVLEGRIVTQYSYGQKIIEFTRYVYPFLIQADVTGRYGIPYPIRCGG
jgi:hypothetical protein